MAIGGLGLPPWAVLAALLGIASAALFYLLFCSQIGRLPLYLLIGTVPALLGGLLGTQLGPTPWSIGEAHLLAICGAAWSALAIARLGGL